MKLPENLTPIPHHPAYLVRPDGRVYSLRTYKWLSESGAQWRTPDRRRVRLGSTDFRVRDLVLLTYGTAGDFEERAWAEREAYRESEGGESA